METAIKFMAVTIYGTVSTPMNHHIQQASYSPCCVNEQFLQPVDTVWNLLANTAVAP